MEITKLERTISEAARNGSLRSTFSKQDSNEEIGLNVSPEINTAAKTLAAKKRVRKHVATTLINTTTARWL